MIPLIYSLNTGAVRRWAIPTNRESDESLLNAVSLGKGEGLLKIDSETYKTLGNLDLLQDFVSKQTGISPYVDGKRIDRYVVLDAQGNVTNTTFLDPLCDDVVIEGTLELNDVAEPGWKKENGVFTPPIIVKTQGQIDSENAKLNARK